MSTLSVQQLPRSTLQEHHSVTVFSFVENASHAIARKEPSSVHARIVVPLSGDLRLSLTGGELSEVREPFVVAAGANPAATEHTGYLECFEVILPPWGVRTLTGDRVLPADGILPLSDLSIGRTFEDHASAEEAARWLDRRLVNDPWVPDQEVQYAAYRLNRTRGQQSIRALATEVGWSERYFSQRFADAVGVGPKRYARLLRFDAAYSAIGFSSEPFAAIAAACGYADQAHMTREFAEFAHSSPTTVRSQAQEFMT
ncbi:MAG: AraC family transcriptional regulator [Pseudomonadota bacterium]